MDKQTAANIISDTFESPFDKAKFVYFIKNLLNKIDETKALHIQGHYIPESFRDYVKAYERIGTYTYTDPANANTKIDVLIVHLQREKSLERARTAQRNFVARYLKERDEKEAGLVAFVSPDEQDWRFSLVKMDYLLEESPSGKIKVRTELTPARRWSFLVGKNESSHTAQSQLVPILQDDAHNPTLKQLEAAFNIEKVTKEFFIKYRRLYDIMHETLDALVAKDERVRDDFTAKSVNTIDFSKKLLGQIVFLYFLSKKGWLGVPENKVWGDGDRRFLRSLFENCNDKHENFFNDYLEYLFYDALSSKDRGGIDPSYYNRFNCKIPFLNGGLFDPISNYDWVHADILLPNELFSNRRKTEEGDIGTGILDVFDRYNFTVKEDEPLEKEVAIDPEMLGKVFENMLEVKDRKSKGTYYTPREIVHYMCQESLINYLDTAINTGDLPLVEMLSPQGKLFGKPDPQQGALKAPAYQAVIPRNDIEALVRMGEHAIENETIAIQKLNDIEQGKIKSSSYKLTLTPSIRDNARTIDDKLKGIRVCDPAIGSGAFLVGMMTEIVRARNVLSEHVKYNEPRNNYIFKRHAIQNCLYGVDIDPGAVEIAKLRLWLSLVVDEEDIKQIQPLPNLDYKIVSGNSLLGFPFKSRRLTAIEQLKQKLFNEIDHDKKMILRSQIDQQLHDAFAASKKSLGYEVNFDFEIYFSEVFHEKGGFDVVIANPPYIRVQRLSYDEIDIYKKRFKSAYRRIDISILFLELAITLLNDIGTATFIASSQFTKTEYGRKIREILAQHMLSMVYFGDSQVFERAINYTSLLFFSKIVKPDYLYFCSADKYNGALELSDFVNTSSVGIDKITLASEAWNLASDKINRLLSKVLSVSKRKLEDLADVEYGLVTGLDSVFIFPNNQNTFLLDDPWVYPLIKPSNTNRYHLSEPTHCVIYPYERVNAETTIVPEIELKELAPSVYKYLLQNKSSLLSRKDSRKQRQDATVEWYSLMRHSSFQKVSREKILTQALCIKNEFCLDTRGFFFTGGSIYSVCSNVSEITNKTLLGILNSNVAEFFYQLVCPIRQNGYRFYAGTFLKALPIPSDLGTISRSIEKLVDEIIAIAGDEDYLTNPAKQAAMKEYDRQIDQMVYKLYGLTPEEIAVVEGSYK